MSDYRYSAAEERWNAVTHLAGALLTVPGVILLWRHAAETKSRFACIFYMASMAALFVCSTAYHLAKEPRRKAFLRNFDHCAIHLLITGTYCPLMLLAVGGAKGNWVFAGSLLLTATGVPTEIFKWKPFRGFSVTLYLISGWLCLLVMPQLVANLSRFGFRMLLAGGIVYTAGVIFYVIKKPYFHAAWHFFVLGGVFCHYCAVLSI